MEAGLASGLLGAPVHSDCRHHGLWQQRRRDDKHDGRTFYWIDSFVLYSGVEQTESTLAHAIVCPTSRKKRRLCGRRCRRRRRSLHIRC